jgi:hypothetical protein
VQNIQARAEIPEGIIMQSSVPTVMADQTASLLACIVQEFEGLVKQLWVYAQLNPDAGFSGLEEQARQLRAGGVTSNFGCH